MRHEFRRRLSLCLRCAGPRRACLCRHEMALEPLARQPRHLIQRTGLFEEVRRAGDDHELLFAAELRERRPVQLDDLDVVLRRR